MTRDIFKPLAQWARDTIKPRCGCPSLSQVESQPAMRVRIRLRRPIFSRYARCCARLRRPKTSQGEMADDNGIKIDVWENRNPDVAIDYLLKWPSNIPFVWSIIIYVIARLGWYSLIRIRYTFFLTTYLTTIIFSPLSVVYLIRWRLSLFLWYYPWTTESGALPTISLSVWQRIVWYFQVLSGTLYPFLLSMEMHFANDMDSYSMDDSLKKALCLSTGEISQPYSL